MGEALEKLRRFRWEDFGVAFAVLFGSRLRGRVLKGDWDIAVWLDDPERAADLQHALAKHLGVREQDVDLLVLNSYEVLPCTLVIEVLGRGKPVYYRDFDAFLDAKLRMLLPCFDFEIAARKLKLLEAQVEAVTKRWES